MNHRGLSKLSQSAFDGPYFVYNTLSYLQYEGSKVLISSKNATGSLVGTTIYTFFDIYIKMSQPLLDIVTEQAT
jgi:hypothetical protein